MTIELELDCKRHHCGNCDHWMPDNVYKPQDGATCVIFEEELKKELHEIDQSFIDYLRCDKCLEATKSKHYSITIYKNIACKHGKQRRYFCDYIGKPLEFYTVNDALEYLDNRGFTLKDVLQCKFHRKLIKKVNDA